MSARARWLGWPLLLAAACKADAKPPSGAAIRAETAPATAPASAPAPAPASAPASASAPAPAALAPPTAPDGGLADCRVLRGPIALPLNAPCTLEVRETAVDVLQNDDGRPHVVSFPADPLPLPAARTPEPEPAERGASAGLSVPCAVAGDRVFCPDRSGAVHRALRDGSGDRIVASSRRWTRIAAGLLGGAHAALAYLSSRQTTEGWVTEAWLAIDDRAPIRISEDGSGATAITLAPRGGSLLALSVDARTALTALHARAIGFADGRPQLGEDEVVFVGGPGDRRTRPALAVPPSDTGPAWALLPISKDIGSFGLAVVRVDDPPRVDEPMTWSMYPNGLDPAPVAAATARAGRTFVARVRPRDARPGSGRVLELGEIAPDGSFAAHELVPTHGDPSDVALAADRAGALWLGWVDGAGGWLERLACTSPR
jgi:hypothetical protein